MKHKKLLPKHHTGKRVHHRHTAYGPLVLVLLLGFMPLFAVSKGVANAAATDPVTRNESIYAVVPGPKPETAPVITSPTQGAVFTSNDPILVAGECPDTMLVKIFKNNVLAGAAFCENGRFSVSVDLFIGANSIVARAYNANNFAGPASEAVGVQMRIENTKTAPTKTKQFFVTSEIEYKGVNVGDAFTLPLTVSGGKAPYAISIGWGDGKTDLVSRSKAGEFEVSHTYDSRGKGYKSSYDVTIVATDEAGNKSFIHFEVIVSGEETSVVGTIKSGYNWSAAMRTAWQLLGVGTLLVFSFWLGERREAFLYKRKLGGV